MPLKKSLVADVLHWLGYAKYGLAGALGAVSATHTFEMAVPRIEASSTVLTIASLVGAVLMIVIARRFHTV